MGISDSLLLDRENLDADPLGCIQNVAKTTVDNLKSLSEGMLNM
jgi:hypothetical protein